MPRKNTLTSGLNPNQGILTMDNCELWNAQTAVLVGKRASSNAVMAYTGGGVLLAGNSTFSNNIQDIRMSGTTALTNNSTTISNCTFGSTTAWMNTFSGFGSRAMVQLENVFWVKFFDNAFKPAVNSNGDTTICIKAINANIVAHPSGGPGNTFDNAFYGIYIAGSFDNLISNNIIRTRNGIFISNSIYDRVIKNTFSLGLTQNAAYSNSLRTGVYMTECSNYQVSGNGFTGVTTNTVLEEGICMNNSGPLPNMVYDNSFTFMHQGVWAQNQNYNPNSVTNEGLQINCCRFNLCDYDIGVQTPLVQLDTTFTVPTYLPMNWQSSYSSQSAAGGIAKTQGIASNANIFANVRNTYTSETSSGNENKFYSFTPFAYPPQVMHGSFLGNIFRVKPYNVYCDSNEVMDVVGSPTPGVHSVYCPDSTGITSLIALNSQIGTLSAQLTTMNTSFASQLDGGNTPGLLTSIHGTAPGASWFRDTLLSKAFLSDTVLIAYFTSPYVMMPYIQDVFVKNAPVSPKIWKLLLDMGLPATMMDTLNAHQNVAQPNARDTLAGFIALAMGERSRAIAQKVLYYFDNPTSTTAALKDTLAALIVLNGLGDVARQLIELDLKFGDYTAAGTKLASYTLANTALQTKYTDFKTLLISVMQDSAGIHSLESNGSWLSAMQTVAADWDHPCRQEANDILFAVFNQYVEEQKFQPQPAEDAGSRHAPTGNETTPAAQGILKDLIVYPNPTANELYVKNLANNDYVLSITNVNGMVLNQQTVKASQLNKIDTHNLLNGIYFVNLYNSHNLLVKSSKLIISK